MRTLVRLLLIAIPLAIAYAIWPVQSALQIREAVIAGDTETLSRKIEWEALRASLKTSISPETVTRLMQDPDAPKPTLWQRIKAVVAPSMAETVIERYVTPEHLPVLLGYRRIFRGSVRAVLGLKEPPSVLEGTWLGGSALDRFASFARREVVEQDDVGPCFQSAVEFIEVANLDFDFYQVSEFAPRFLNGVSG